MSGRKILTGEEFVQFVESQPDIWPKIPGTIVTHIDSGKGTIQNVQERKNGVPLLEIKFSSEPSIDQYTSDAFKIGYFTDIQISDELMNSLTAWRENISNRQALDVAATAQRKKKEVFTEPPKIKIKPTHSPDSKSKMETLATEHERQARLMTPKQLHAEILKMKELVEVAPTSKLNIRLSNFIRVYKIRDDCGPLGKEIRVPTTS